MPANHPDKLSRTEAEDLGITGLTYVASDPVLMPRFLAMSGIEASRIREAAGEPGFLAGVLQFILAHEPTLTAFCEATDTRPAHVSAALRALPFGEDNFEAST
ncbi:DUF3572 domain-containing protein [Mesorhizobium sp. CAU 1741]|uniref:DUF3572 domain-containing protein n=1 Tax=Mesorhizobium sp. CAU 1741 TaxID=3140366 RepID=UPI00325B8AFC